MNSPVLVERADTRPIVLPRPRRRVSVWHPVCVVAGLIPTVLLAWGVTL